jgi:predicted Zn finger-like uncharacterized protein
MIVDCNRCHSEYRLNEALFRGSRGMQVRCRSCGNSILVLNPGGLASELAVLRFAAPPCWATGRNPGASSDGSPC